MEQEGKQWFPSNSVFPLIGVYVKAGQYSKVFFSSLTLSQFVVFSSRTFNSLTLMVLQYQASRLSTVEDESLRFYQILLGKKK